MTTRQNSSSTMSIKTRSQVVARIDDRTAASQHLWGHVTSSVTWLSDSQYAISYYRWSFGTKPLSLTVSEIFNGECDAMVNMTIRPLKISQDHSFWYQSISHIRLPIGSQ